MKIAQYFQTAVEELRHVRWPTRQQAVRLSIIVLIFTACATIFFGGIDFLFAQVIKALLALAL